MVPLKKPQKNLVASKHYEYPIQEKITVSDSKVHILIGTQDAKMKATLYLKIF